MKKFAFLVHPRDLGDVSQYAPKAAGKRPELVAKVLEWMPAHFLSHVTGVRSKATGEEIAGEFISVPLLPHQIVSLNRREVVQRVVDAATLAVERGAQIVGLGGYTAVVGGSGKIVSQRVDVPVTSGNCYTVATALDALMALTEQLDFDLAQAKVCVVGATGSIGSVCARELARRVRWLTLAARSRSRLSQLAKTISSESSCGLGLECDVERAVSEADVIVSATSSGGGIIKMDSLRPGAIVCDIGVPHDVSLESARCRPDVLVIEGGVVEAPGDPEFNFDFGYARRLCMACMAETMALTMAGRFENFSIGRGLEYENVLEIKKLAALHGFRLAGLRSFGAPLSQESVDRYKELRTQAQRGLTIVP